MSHIIIPVAIVCIAIALAFVNYLNVLDLQREVEDLRKTNKALVDALTFKRKEKIDSFKP